MTRRALARVCLGITVAYWVAQFVVTHTPLPKLPYVPVTDKTGHFVSYALLASGLMASFLLSGRANPAATVLAVLLAYGAVEELTQIPVGRSCEMADWYADAAGAAAGVVVVAGVARVARMVRERET